MSDKVYTVERQPGAPRGTWQVMSTYHGEPVATGLSHRLAVRCASEAEAELAPCADCGRSVPETGEAVRLCSGCWFARLDAGAMVRHPSRSEGCPLVAPHIAEEHARNVSEHRPGTCLPLCGACSELLARLSVASVQPGEVIR
jgi:hypothetical protein